VLTNKLCRGKKSCVCELKPAKAKTNETRTELLRQLRWRGEGNGYDRMEEKIFENMEKRKKIKNCKNVKEKTKIFF
jgi:hypothetical protein